MSKRRVRGGLGGIRSAVSKLVVKHRELNENEKKEQRMRFSQLQPGNLEEEDEGEEEFDDDDEFGGDDESSDNGQEQVRSHFFYLYFTFWSALVDLEEVLKLLNPALGLLRLILVNCHSFS